MLKKKLKFTLKNGKNNNNKSKLNNPNKLRQKSNQINKFRNYK